jgi:3-oxoadipate CoA-transferase beta subunit
MDLAIGAKNTWVMMEHLTKRGESKLVERCAYPLTALHCVKRVITDLAVIELSADGARVTEIVDGLEFAQLQALTAITLVDAR